MMDRERLERLSQLLRNLKLGPNQEFNMGTWAEFNVKEGGHLCGTAACAAGWAALDPWFNEQGFVLYSWRINVITSAEQAAKDIAARTPFDDGHANIVVGTILEYRGWRDLDACARFFGISYPVAQRIFSHRSYVGPGRPYVTPAVVADRIDELLALPDEEGARYEWCSRHREFTPEEIGEAERRAGPGEPVF